MMNQCVEPRAIQEGDLLDYLYVDAPAQVAEHIARCPFCSAQVEQLRMVDAQLLAVFYRESCPAPEALADFALRRLGATEKLRVAAHVRDCAACKEEIASVRDLTDEGPPSLLARLRESLALALVARPVLWVPAPVRGEGWQGRFEVKGWIITLAAHTRELTGRVRWRDAPHAVDYSGEAWLLDSEMETVEQAPRSVVDERGRLRFTDLASGSYALLLQIGEQNVALEMIEIT